MDKTSRAKGIAILSGSPFPGKSIFGYGLAGRLAELSQRTLYLNLQFDKENSFYHEARQSKLSDAPFDVNGPDCEISRLYPGFDAIHLCPQDDWDAGDALLRKLSEGIFELSRRYDYMIISAPSGLNPVSSVISAMCDEIFLLIQQDALSVASGYCLLKGLVSESMEEKISTIFADVESADRASTAKGKFDSITSNFLNLKLRDGGYTLRGRNDDRLMTSWESRFSYAAGYAENVRPETIRAFHNETEKNNISGNDSHSRYPDDMKTVNL